MSRDKREKLTDRINKSEYVFSRKVDSFEEAYPTITSLRVEVTEEEIGLSSASRTWTFTEKNFIHAVNCSNSMCYGGGVEIGWMIHDMARNKQTDHEEIKRCEGYEGSQREGDDTEVVFMPFTSRHMWNIKKITGKKPGPLNKQNHGTGDGPSMI